MSSIERLHCSTNVSEQGLKSEVYNGLIGYYCSGTTILLKVQLLLFIALIKYSSILCTLD